MTKPTEPLSKRFKLDVNYSTPISTPSYAERRSKELDMLAPNGGFGPDGFRTPLPFPNTPVSIAGDTPTLGNLPFPGPVVPVRMFLEIAEEAGRKICDGTIILRCRSGSIAATSKECGTCRMDINNLKNTICKTWKNFKNDPSKQRFNRVKLLSEYDYILEKFDGYWRMDLIEAIGRISDWKPKVEKMKALWFKEAVIEEIILELPEDDEAAIPIPTETIIQNFYDMPKDICFICKRDIGICMARYCQCGLKLEKNGPDVCSCGISTVGVGRVCDSCYSRLRVQGDYINISILKTVSLQPRKERYKSLNALDEMDAKIGGPRLFVCTFSRRSNSGGPPILKRRVNGATEKITQHELLWEMLMRKNGMSGRYSGNRLAVADERVGSSLPGKGPVVWALKAHADTAPCYGSLLASIGRTGYSLVHQIDTSAKILMSHPDDTFLITCTTPESFFCNPNHILDFLNRFPQQRMVTGYGQQPRSIALERIFFAFQGLDKTGRKINKCFTAFSGLELFDAITNRSAFIQRTATSLNSSHVQGFLYQAEQEWRKRMDLRQTAMNSGRGGIDQDATQPTASQVLRDWTVPNRTFHSNE